MIKAPTPIRVCQRCHAPWIQWRSGRNTLCADCRGSVPLPVRGTRIGVGQTRPIRIGLCVWCGKGVAKISARPGDQAIACADCRPRRRYLRHVRAAYGLDRYDEFAASHGGRCDLCLETRQLVVDHDHRTGAIRGLLCNRCNTLLGWFADDPEMLARAIRYLQTVAVA